MIIIIDCLFSEVPQLAQPKSEVTELHIPSDVTLISQFPEIVDSNLFGDVNECTVPIW